jgi:hypothetical protein
LAKTHDCLTIFQKSNVAVQGCDLDGVTYYFRVKNCTKDDIANLLVRGQLGNVIARPLSDGSFYQKIFILRWKAEVALDDCEEDMIRSARPPTVGTGIFLWHLVET